MLNKEFRPELISRRGELNAWVFALVVSIALGFMFWAMGNIPTVAWVFWGFLFFAALSTSFGNWMDRSTVMGLDDNGIAFENGIRQVALNWQEVKSVNVIPARWGKTVQLIGEESHFEFRTLGEVQYQGEVTGRLGFVEGDDVLKEILKKTKLRLEKEEKGSYYYSRV
ncbi:MAG: hypothetical protein HN392_06920 [Anaerolineae bacterium]|jgi:hypothetical protein|nr:hypothetical protein [Anaerolineae bacterium]MBT7073708.1 hypothetical protein [Anaerolineae bacterium]MBT7782901.1 hypothetical protein [Anaerolineae bacterium]